MKRCPFCAEEIQDAAIVCKHCSRELTAGIGGGTAVASTAPATTTARPKWVAGAVLIGAVLSLFGGAAGGFGVLLLWAGFGALLSGSMMKRVGGGLIGALAVGGVLMSITGSSKPPTTTSSSSSSGLAPAPQPQTPVLALLASRGYESDAGGFWYVEGQVRNVSDQPMKNVAVVATWYTKNDQFITSDEALIDYNPLLPGQTSPFKTITRSNPAMAKYSVAFKELLGGTINMRDDRKQAAPPPTEKPSASTRRVTPLDAPPEPLPFKLEIAVQSSGEAFQITNNTSYSWPRCIASIGASEAAIVPFPANGTITIDGSAFRPQVPPDGTTLVVTCRVADRSFVATAAL